MYLYHLLTLMLFYCLFVCFAYTMKVNGKQAVWLLGVNFIFKLSFFELTSSFSFYFFVPILKTPKLLKLIYRFKWHFDNRFSMWLQTLGLHIDQIHACDLKSCTADISQREMHVRLTAVIMKRCLRVQK